MTQDSEGEVEEEVKEDLLDVEEKVRILWDMENTEVMVENTEAMEESTGAMEENIKDMVKVEICPFVLFVGISSTRETVAMKTIVPSTIQALMDHLYLKN